MAELNCSPRTDVQPALATACALRDGHQLQQTNQGVPRLLFASPPCPSAHPLWRPPQKASQGAGSSPPYRGSAGRALCDVCPVRVLVHRELHLPEDHALGHQPLEGLGRGHGADIVQHLHGTTGSWGGWQRRGAAPGLSAESAQQAANSFSRAAPAVQGCRRSPLPGPGRQTQLRRRSGLFRGPPA